MLQKKGNIFLIIFVSENIQKKTSHAANSRLFANLFFTRVAKYLKDTKHNSLLPLVYLSLGIICYSTLNVFLELRSRKTVCVLKEIISADKCPCKFSTYAICQDSARLVDDYSLSVFCLLTRVIHL